MRVAYIWSRELQNACNELPCNIGRSSIVHELHRAYGLFDDDLLMVVEPNIELGDKRRLERFHGRDYIGTLSSLTPLM